MGNHRLSPATLAILAVQPLLLALLVMDGYWALAGVAGLVLIVVDLLIFWDQGRRR